MSVEAISRVLNHSKAKGSQKLVLIGIANHHGDEGAWPAISTLARYANLSERRVQQMIRELEEMGELKIEKNQGGGRQQYKTNRYWILTQEKDSGVKPVSARGEAGFVLGVKPVSPETSIETKEKPLKGFAEFWEIYPRHENKAMAERAYRKALKKTTPEILLERLKQYIDHNKRNEIKYAYAATWLNQERWQDEYEIPKAKVDRSIEHTKAMLDKQKELEKNWGAVPKCQHGNNPARCLDCFGKPDSTNVPPNK